MRVTNSAIRFVLLSMMLLSHSEMSQAAALPDPVGSFVDVTLMGTTVAARPELAGVVLEDRLIPYEFTNGVDKVRGEIQNRVVRSSVDNTLDFYWMIRPDAESTGSISAFRVSGFGDFALDADWRIDGIGTENPKTARNFGNGSVNFLFDDHVAGDERSRLFFLDTSATRYRANGSYDLLCGPTGCVSPSYPAFVPLNLDCNGDGVVDVFDLNCACESKENDFVADILDEIGSILGDVDGDGDVAFSDFLVLSDNYGGKGEYTDGDLNCDGGVDFGDFLLLANNFGGKVPKGLGLDLQVAGVPEPTAATLLSLGFLGLLGCRRRQTAKR